jgi:hypothetical protein
MGVADLGLTSSLASYSYSTPRFVGEAGIRTLSVSGPDFDLYSLSFQLNVVVVLTHGSRTAAYWIQDVPFLNTSTQVLSFEDNVWNLSSSTLSMYTNSITGNGTVFSLGNGEDYYADGPGSSYPGNGVRFPYPLTFSAQVVASTLSGVTHVGFEYEVNGKGWVTYDNVTFPWTHGWSSSGFLVDGSASPPAGAYYDAEWILGGPGDGSSTADVSSNVSLALEEFNGHNLQAIPNAFSFGVDTAESISNVVETVAPGPGLPIPGALVVGGYGNPGPLYGPSEVASLNATLPAGIYNGGELEVNSSWVVAFSADWFNVTLYPGPYDFRILSGNPDSFNAVLTAGWFVQTLGEITALVFSPPSSLPGGLIAVSGAGFTASQNVSVQWLSGISAGCTTNASSGGSFSCSLTAPTVRAGWYGLVGRTNGTSIMSTGIGSFEVLTNLTETIQASPSEADAFEPFSFTTSASGGVAPYSSFNWTFGDGASASTSGPNTSHEFRAPGNYTVRVGVSDQLGNVAEDSTLVVVTPDPHILTLGANRSSADVGQSVTFVTTVTAGSGNDQFVWSGLPGPCSISESTAVCDFLPTAGTFPVSVSVTDSSGYTSASGASPFVVYPAPVLSAPRANRSSFDVGQLIEFTAVVQVAGSGVGSFLWQWPQGPTAGLSCTSSLNSTLDCVTSDFGNFSVKASMTDLNGAVGISPAAVLQVLPDPQTSAPLLNPSIGDVGVPLEASTTTVGGTGIYDYVWAGIPGCASVNVSLTCAPTEAGSFNVTVTVRDSNGYESTSPPSALFLNSPLLLSFNGPTSALTAGEVGTYTAAVSGGTGPCRTTWVFPGTGRTSGSEVNHTFGQAGTFKVDLWANDSVGGSVARSFEVTVGAAPPVLSFATIESNLPLIGVIAVIAAVIGITLAWRPRRPTIRVPDPPRAASPPTSWENDDLW